MIKLKTDELSLKTYISYLGEGILVEHAPGSTKVYQDALAAHALVARVAVLEAHGDSILPLLKNLINYRFKSGINPQDTEEIVEHNQMWGAYDALVEGLKGDLKW